jgi:zinc-ribbon domain
MADRYCTNCGQGLSEGDRFCRDCGRPVQGIPRVPTPEADAAVPPPPQGAQDTSARNFLRKWWPYLAIVVLLLLIISNSAMSSGGSPVFGWTQGESEYLRYKDLARDQETFMVSDGDLYWEPDAALAQCRVDHAPNLDFFDTIDLHTKAEEDFNIRGWDLNRTLDEAGVKGYYEQCDRLWADYAD